MVESQASVSPDPLAYDGTVLVNSRAVEGPLHLIAHPESTTEPLTVEEVTAFLGFVENCAISAAIHYDPTLPRATLAPLQAAVSEFCGAYGSGAPMIGPIPLPPDGIDTCAVRAVQAARRHFAEIDVGRLGRGERALQPEDTDAFRTVLERAVEMAADTRRLELGREVLAKNPRGAKLLFGLVHPSSDALLRSTWIRVQALPGDRHGLLFGAMINRFRVHLLCKWASERASAHLVGDYGDWSNVSSLSRYVWQDFLGAEQRQEGTTYLESPELHRRLSGLLDGVADLSLPQGVPPIGLVALMRTRGSPMDVLRTALEMVARTRAGRAFRAEIWRAARSGSSEQTRVTAELRQIAERHYQDAKWDPRSVEKERRFLPTLANVVWGAVPLVPLFDLARTTYDAVRELWSYGFEVIKNSGRRGFLTFFHRSASDLEHVRPLEFEAKVRAVFRRPFSLPPQTTA